MIAGAFAFFLGGEAQWADSLMNPLAGMLAGFTARFFSQERVIAPPKAMFVGMFVPILHMGLLIIFTRAPEHIISLMDKIGLPLVITNSIAIAVFTAMIRVALNEQEQEAALATQRALRIAEESLPYLRQGLHFQTAAPIATLLKNELNHAAVSITNKEQVLAHIGLGSDHHHQGDRLWTELSRVAIDSGEIKVAIHHRELQCNHIRCPLQAAVLVPLRQSGEVVGLVKMFFQRVEHVRAVYLALAKGLDKLMSNQLDIIVAEKVKSLVQEAQLRNLQAQINPHFLFNTLNLSLR